MTLTVVTIRQLCSACHIVEGALREIFARVQQQLPALELEWVVYDDPNTAMDYPGLELPKFPAIFLKGEQMTAGSIPSLRELTRWMEENEA